MVGEARTGGTLSSTRCRVLRIFGMDGDAGAEEGGRLGFTSKQSESRDMAEAIDWGHGEALAADDEVSEDAEARWHFRVGDSDGEEEVEEAGDGEGPGAAPW